MMGEAEETETRFSAWVNSPAQLQRGNGRMRCAIRAPQRGGG
jgi:hypothetical protein